MIQVSGKNYRCLDDIQKGLKGGDLTCVQLVQAYLTEVKATTDLNAYVEVYENEAMTAARGLDERIHTSSAKLGPLFGAVLSVKDVIAQENHHLTAGSRILEGYTSIYTATAVQRLLDADAIIIGRVNCDEFAMGSDNRTSVYGPVRNGEHKEHVPGGSSGGSAVSVQVNTCLASIGSDTGGSVRQPASFCGLIGFKPSYGRISRHGLIAYGSSFDQIGVIGKKLDDVTKIYEVMKGVDDYDATLIDPLMVEDRPIRKKLAYLKDAVEHPSLQPEIRETFLKKVKSLQERNIEVQPVDFELIDYLIPAYYVLTSAEASSNLSRYDGLRYGRRSPHATTLLESYTKTRTEGFGLEVKRRILLGTFVLSVGYYDAYFAKAQKVRRLIKEQISRVLAEYDGLLLPTTPRTAWKLGAEMSPVQIYLSDVFSVLANLVGFPAVSLPMGKDVENLPFGIQLISGTFQEHLLFVYSKLILDDEDSVVETI